VTETVIKNENTGLGLGHGLGHDRSAIAPIKLGEIAMNTAVKDLFTNIEKGFNVAGTIPVVSFFSGMVRAVAGKVQMIAGAILSAFSYINFLITKHPKWAYLADVGNEFILHGALNILRGLSEASLCASTVVGNVVLLLPNMSKEDMFSPYFSYGTLSDRWEPSMICPQ
jgi:hypothetical protein